MIWLLLGGVGAGRHTLSLTKRYCHYCEVVIEVAKDTSRQLIGQAYKGQSIISSHCLAGSTHSLFV